MKKILSLLSVGATVSSLIATTPVVMAASKTTTKQNNKPAFAQKQGRPMQRDAAKLLGITAEDLKARFTSGKTFDQVLADLGISQDQWKAKLDANREARLAEMKTKANKFIERTNQPHKHGDFNGHRFGQMPKIQK